MIYWFNLFFLYCSNDFIKPFIFCSAWSTISMDWKAINCQKDQWGFPEIHSIVGKPDHMPGFLNGLFLDPVLPSRAALK